MNRLLAITLVGALTGGSAGCGGPAIAPVSGIVRVDEKPYKNAVVTFQPLGSKGNPNPGRGSAGVTDEQGKFTLLYDDGGRSGAIVGPHRVRIFTKSGADVPADLKAESIPGVRFVEPIPAEWHENSDKTFDVPSGGTTAILFDIHSIKAEGKNKKK